jgi:hypothetical protein
MDPNTRIIQCHQLKSGDVLLCVLEGRDAAAIARMTHTTYTHAAICYSSTEVVEVMEGGIRKATVQQFVSECVHAAVLRNPYVWTQTRVKALQEFLDDSINKQTAYHDEGVKTFRQRRKEHQWALLAKVKAFVTDGLEPQPHKKLEYICSELVAACFVEVGIMDSGAAIAYQSDTYSAGDLAKETMFGFFVGYLKPEPTVQIPADDEFANALMLSEVAQMDNKTATPNRP